MILLAALLAVGGVGAVALTVRLHNSSDLSAAQPLGPASRTVIFLINGVSPSDLARVHMPHLADLASRGTTYRRAWVGQMENVGVASAATLATGVFPRSTGMVGARWRNPQSGALEQPALPGQVQLGAIDEVMQSHAAVPLAVSLKRAQPRAPILAVGGAGCAIANAAASWLADYVLCPRREGGRWVPGDVTGHALPARVARKVDVRAPVVGKGKSPSAWATGAEDDFIAQYAMEAMRMTRPSLVIVSFDELSARKQRLGSVSDAVARPVLRGVDRDIGLFVTELRREGIANRTAFVVTAGAAMPIAASAVPASDLAGSINAAGGQRVYVNTGEAGTIGLQDILQAQPVAQALQGRHLRGLDAVYYKVHSGKGWTYRPQYLDPDLPAAFSTTVSYLLGTVASPESPDVVAVFAPGYALARRGDNGSSGPGVQWDSQHVPLIVAGHGVQAGIQSSYPARTVDIAPTIAALMGLGPMQSDGVVLADALQEPGNGEQAAQRAAANRLDFYVATLQNREQAAGR